MTCEHDKKFQDPRYRTARCLICELDKSIKIGPIQTRVIQGEDHAVMFAAKIITYSKWFMVTPLPDDEWEFTVKEGMAGFILAFHATGVVDLDDAGLFLLKN